MANDGASAAKVTLHGKGVAHVGVADGELTGTTRSVSFDEDVKPALTLGDPVKEAVVDAVEDFGNLEFDAGFGIGVLEGIDQAAADFRAIADLVWKLMTFQWQEVARDLCKQLSAVVDGATWKRLGKQFADGWTNPDDFARGEFRGRVVGYVVAQIAVAVATAGAATEATVGALAGGRYAAVGTVLEGDWLEGAAALGRGAAVEGAVAETTVGATDAAAEVAGDTASAGRAAAQLPAEEGAGSAEVLEIRETKPTVAAEPEPPVGEPATTGETMARDTSLDDDVAHAPRTAPKGRGLPELAISKSTLFEEVVEDGDRFVVEFRGTTPAGEEVWLGKGYVRLDETGIPESYPEFTIDATTMDGKRAIHVYDDVVSESAADGTPSYRGKGARTSVTERSIGRFLDKYEKRFGHRPDALQGQLAWANRANFQRAFYELRQQGFASEMAADEAIRQISFGRHRIPYGYDEFEVQMRGTVPVDLGPPYGMQRVPDRIFVIARKGSGL